MRVKYGLYGNSPSLAFLAGILAEAGLEVLAYRRAEKIETRGALRPTRLQAQTLRSIKTFLLRHGADPQFLDAAPEVESWSTASGNRYDFRLKAFEAEDRWVESTQLLQSLWSQAERLGARILVSELLPPVQVQEQTRVVLDVDVEQISHWPSSFFWKPDLAYRMEAAEMWLPEGRIADSYSAQLIQLEGTLAFLEPHPQGGFAISFYSGSRYAVERAQQAVLSSRGRAPSLWRALASVNRGLRQRQFSLKVGISGIHIPGVFICGQALGRYSPIANLHDSESFAQVERLCRLFSADEQALSARAYYKQSEDWTQKESATFRSNFKRAQLWEKFIFSDRTQKMTLSAVSVMPAALRRFLKSPL